MSELKPITSKADKSVSECLQEMVDRQDHFAGIVVVGLNKDGDHYLRTSNMTQQQKAGCYCLFQAYMNEIFSCAEDV